ncbi:hypothetical protein WN51_00149 [Melipona quadrifasciata]|uniref:Uncharacterized protein n=1 Tax=Melipona quadrifasciata TaxID=166423 RepID=A0A0N0BL16_9HYME|nr:hypothetical protein WN51_00149 [Melipona quadrifasciata]
MIEIDFARIFPYSCENPVINPYYVQRSIEEEKLRNLAMKQKMKHFSADAEHRSKASACSYGYSAYYQTRIKDPHN